jgi:hypothetical protein
VLQLFDQSTIDRGFLRLHASPLVPVVPQVSHIFFLPIDASAESSDRPHGCARSGALDPPHVEGGQEEQQEGRCQYVRAHAVVMVHQVGDGQHGADHAHNRAHDPTERSSREAARASS